MYTPPAFQIDRAASLSFAAERGFGLVVASAAGGFAASPVPFHLSYTEDGTPYAAFHVARANPLGAAAAVGGRWLLSVMGPDAYVSPDWYASPDQVPTWLYQTVQLSGPVRVMADAKLVQHLDELSVTFERWLAPKPAWTVDKVTPARRQKLLKAIVGIEMAVETIEGSFKLNQHKSDADHIGVANALAAQPGEASHTLATRMIAMRTQLNYEPADAAA